MKGKLALELTEAGIMDNVYEIVQGRLKEDKDFFLDVQKTYDTVWRDGLWLKLWDMDVKGRCGV